MTANATSVSVLLNRGDGTFEARRDYPTGRSESLAIHDLNGDGKPDVVTANAGNSLSVLLDAGDGTLQPRSDYATGRNPGPVSIADLNGDGAPDLVTASSKDNTVSVLLNRGDGVFAPKRDFAIASAGLYVTTEICGRERRQQAGHRHRERQFRPEIVFAPVFAFAPPQRR